MWNKLKNSSKASKLVKNEILAVYGGGGLNLILT